MGRVGNWLAGAVLVALAALAVLAVNRLGFAGLVALGLLALLVCTMATLNEDVPTWGEHVFRARMERRGSPAGPDLGFYRWCGVVLTATGVAGFVWQNW